MRSFHLTIHAAPAAAVDGAAWSGPDIVLQTLDLAPTDRTLPLPLSFEAAMERLQSLPRLFIEPDGSFVWRSDRTDAQAWQVDGQLFDGGPRLLYVELKGTCAPGSWQQLLEALGADVSPLIFQIVPAAVFVPREEVERWLAF